MKNRNYILDLFYGATKYPCAWLKPRVYWGHFSDNQIGSYQRVFFEVLRKNGFTRTPWQLVFPDQTAGLIKKIEPKEDGINEYHVRFYGDGIIDCEAEIGRFNKLHWSGPRKNGRELLEQILEEETGLMRVKDTIRTMFGTKHFAEECIREN